MSRAIRMVVAAPFFIRQKGLLPPLLPLFYPKTKRERRINRKRRMTTHRGKEENTDTQNPETGRTKQNLPADKTLTAA
jgi:hypothetical protein